MASLPENYTKFFEAETLFKAFSPDNLTGRAIFKFGGDKTEKIPFVIRTGPMGLGAPTERKAFRSIDFYADGAVNGRVGVRVYLDGRYVCSGAVTCSEQATVHRRINIPVAKCQGHTVDIELAGNVRLRAVSTRFEGVV